MGWKERKITEKGELEYNEERQGDQSKKKKGGWKGRQEGMIV